MRPPLLATGKHLNFRAGMAQEQLDKLQGRVASCTENANADGFHLLSGIGLQIGRRLGSKVRPRAI